MKSICNDIMGSLQVPDGALEIMLPSFLLVGVTHSNLK